MFPTIWDGIKLFFLDKAYFASKWDKWVAKVRGVLLALGVAAGLYADKLEAAVPAVFQGKVRVIAIVLSGVAVMLRAGDKTPPYVKAMAADSGYLPGTPATAKALKP